MEGTAEKGRLEICFCNEDVFLKRKEVRGNAFKRKTWTIPGPGKSREVKKKKKRNGHTPTWDAGGFLVECAGSEC